MQGSKKGPLIRPIRAEPTIPRAVLSNLVHGGGRRTPLNADGVHRVTQTVRQCGHVRTPRCGSRCYLNSCSCDDLCIVAMDLEIETVPGSERSVSLT
jgi:hypothetical protein